MNKNIFLTVGLVLMIAGFVFALNMAYSVTLKNSNGHLSFEKLSILEGTAPDRLIQPETGYTAKVISLDNEVLYSFKFEVQSVIMRAPPSEWFDSDTGEQIFFPNATEEMSSGTITPDSYTLIVPYFPNAKSIEIYDKNNNFLLSISVLKYAEKKYFSGRPVTTDFNFSYLLIGSIISFALITIFLIISLVLRERKLKNN